MPKGYPKSGINKGWFKKGHHPSNEFKKGEHFNKPTEFKKGNKPWNYKLTGEDYKKFYKKGFGRPMLGIEPPNKGKFNPNRKWKLSLRDCYKMYCWRLDIFKRDNYTCQDCSKYGCYFNAHHIISFESILKKNNIKSVREGLGCKELWDLDNGITYCKECHIKKGRHRG